MFESLTSIRDWHEQIYSTPSVPASHRVELVLPLNESRVLVVLREVVYDYSPLAPLYTVHDYHRAQQGWVWKRPVYREQIRACFEAIQKVAESYAVCGAIA